MNSRQWNDGNRHWFHIKDKTSQFGSKREIIEIKIDCIFQDKTSQFGSKREIKEYLDILDKTNDIEIQVKILSLFAVYLTSGPGTYHDVIITSQSLYDKLYDVLIMGFPEKTGATLNFVSALLYEGDTNTATAMRQRLVVYARNMLRARRCLSVLCRLFCGQIMQQDIWKLLCHCLTEVCRNSHENKIQGSKVIPTAVQKCMKGDIDSAVVLQSLLCNHDRNVQRFVRCGGLLIFSKQLLQNNTYLHLLDTLVQNPKIVTTLLHNTQVVRILQCIVDSHDIDSQIGQQANLILNHITSQIQALRKCNEKSRTSCNKAMSNNKRNGLDDTEKLFKNIIGEILQCQRNRDITNKPSFNDKLLATGKDSIYRNPFIGDGNFPEILEEKEVFNSYKNYECSNAKEMSFSFLLNNNLCQNETYTVHNYSNINKDENFSETNSREIFMKKENCANMSKVANSVNDCETLFKPKFMSTPKSNARKNKRFTHNTNDAHRYYNRLKNITEFSRNKFNNKHLVTKKNKEIKQKSIGGKVFSTINESCSVLMRTVKNIFKTLKMDSAVEKQESHSSNSKNVSNYTNYSFTKYMQRRDAIFGDKLSNISSSNLKTSEFESKLKSSCETCNDTMILKRKLVKNNHLKLTIKKLKFGINSYGCDFKKISAVLWPQDSYMTPSVLYNLYRKLIVK